MAVLLLVAAAVGAAVASGTLGVGEGSASTAEPGAGSAPSEGSSSRDHPGRGRGSATPGHPYANRHLLRDWPAPDGSVPTRREAEADFSRYERIVITSNDGFNPSNGVVAGNGTAGNPWVIEHAYVEGDLYVADTTDHFVVRESYVDGQLTLNWVGDRVHVHDNHLDDLRVNENVERVGEDTAGRIEENRIEYVGQLRHFDGVFRDNVVGPHREKLTEDPGASLGARRKAMQLDGTHGGDVHGNTFTGWVEIKLHGHHHGSCWTCLRHHHGNESEAAPWDHTIRYNRMSFHGNRIEVPEGVALRYTDEAHDADDGQAASEDVAALDEPHRHFTRVYLWNNTLVGGGLRVDVFNAESEDHPRPNPGRLVVRGNENRPAADDGSREAVEGDPAAGVHVNRARWVNITVADNAIVYPEDDGSALDGDETRGVVLDRLADANVTVAGNRVVGAWRGVEARRMPASVHWTVAGNAFEDVGRAVWWDDSVANPPRRG